MLKFPKHTLDLVAACYAFDLGLQQMNANRRMQDLGRRLHALLPRLLFGSLPQKARPAAALMRRRCRQYLRGEWPQLLRDSPAGLTAQQRAALASEAETRRGYAVDPTLENSVRKMEDGRPSQSVTALLSHGMASGAFEQLLAVHFLDPSIDALSAEAQLQYDALRQGALPQPFCDKLLKAITEREQARAQDEGRAQRALQDEAQPVEGVDEVPDPVEPSAEEMRRVRLQRFGLATSGGVSAA